MIYGALFAIVLVLILLTVGFAAGQAQQARQTTETLLLSFEAHRAQQVAALRQLREWIETQTDGLSTEQALLLCDVCHQLEFGDGEMQRVVGPALLLVLDAPIGMGRDVFAADD